jgi:hypothetical protein
LGVCAFVLWGYELRSEWRRQLDIVLAKGRHWPLRDIVLFGDGKGHFAPGPPLPNQPDRSYRNQQ